MPTGCGPQYDIFVSFAHADNERALDSEFGWVTRLAHDLNTVPGLQPKNIFIDHQLKIGDAFSDDLVTTVQNSLLLLLVLSQNYMRSAWCGKELEHFILAHGNDPKKPTDVFVVELTPFVDLINVPDNIQNVRKHLKTAPFWHKPADSASSLVMGYPSPTKSGQHGCQLYYCAVQQLGKSIDSRLLNRRLDTSSVSVVVPSAHASTATRHRNTQSALGTVLLADTTDDLVQLRSAMKARLESEGVGVLPEGDYVGLTPEEFESKLARDLARSELFVQLLSPTVGRTGINFNAPLPQLQFHRALAAKLPIMQWCERSPIPGEIADIRHAELFNTEYLRVTNRTTFEREVLVELEAIVQVAETACVAAQDQPVPDPVKKLIFIDDVAGEKELNERLRAWLRSANCNIRGLPLKASLGSNGIDIVQVLKLCRAGITVFADSAKLEMVYNRLVFFLNLIAESRLKVNRWGIYVTADTAQCDLGLISDDVITITEERLSDFVSGL